MRRVIVVLSTVVAATAFVLSSGGAATDPKAKRYVLELDNAFGLVEGADVKIAGVRAGSIAAMRVDRKSKRALIDMDITKAGFGDLRSDVTCETRPQSLIGEYFIDCKPGTSPTKLVEGSTIPVERTGSTIAPDLVNNILRRPYKERFRIIIAELGAGVGGRAADLSEAVRRASPALRETEDVLEILGRQNRILADLVTNADKVIGDLADNRKDVVRFATETRETAAASAERRDDLQAGFRRLPTFLRELRPTMAELGKVAAAQEPSLRDLNASADQLEDLFTNLGPFARASQVNIRSLAKAAGPGRRAAKASAPVIEQLGKFAEPVPELANNAKFIANHLNDRNFAVEADPRSPGGKGFTGLEVLLYYFYAQGQAINIFDRNGYMLKVNLSETECSEYQNAESLKEHLASDPDFEKRCGARLGPTQPGIFHPDPSAGRPEGKRSQGQRSERRRSKRSAGRRTGSGARRDAPAAQTQEPGAGPLIDLGETLEDILPDKPKLPPLFGDAKPVSDVSLLDYLFGR